MRKAKRTYNPCDDCQYSYSKNGQESGMCKICEFTYFRDRKQSEGEWVENDDGQTVCSHCGETAEVDAWELEMRDKVRYSKTTYCPSCGAKMKGV